MSLGLCIFPAGRVSNVSLSCFARGFRRRESLIVNSPSTGYLVLCIFYGNLISKTMFAKFHEQSHDLTFHQKQSQSLHHLEFPLFLILRLIAQSDLDYCYLTQLF